MSKKLLVVPDVHGRGFWRKVKNWEGEVIFLGDYNDPYPHEGIYPDEALDVFKEILEWARPMRDRVHLLYGNHDWHYVHPGFDASRKCRGLWDSLHEVYEKNSDLFSRYWFEDGVLFTHAGLGMNWLDGETDWRESLEKATPTEFFECGPERWGPAPASGPLWLDYHELQGLRWHNEDRIFTDGEVKFQIFGHTQQERTGGIETDGKTWASIDSREVFILDLETFDVQVWNG